MVFQGDRKAGASLLAPLENRLKAWLLPKVPARIETYHLTLTTILWSILILVFSFLAKHSIHWLWMVSFMIVMQYLTDLLDGAIGRARDTGLVKWGYYMDHFLDYIFLCAILIGYSLLLPYAFRYILFYIMAFFGAFMVNSFLSFAATNEFKIAYLGVGPTEIRLVFIIVNALIVLFGRVYMLKALPYVLGAATFGLFVTVFRTQDVLWKEDMRAKSGAAGDASAPSSPRDPSVTDMARELADGLSKRRVFRNIVLSIAIAAAAGVVVVMKVGHPYHRGLAFCLYGVSWIPFALSFREKRAVMRRHRHALKRKVRPYFIHIAVALALLMIGRAAWVLAPAEITPLGEMSDGELRQSIREDLQSMRVLQASAESLAGWAEGSGLFGGSIETWGPGERDELRAFWRDVVAVCMELEILKTRYRGFYQVDYLVRRDLHAEAFLVAFSAFVSQYRASLMIADRVKDTPFLDRLLNETDEGHGIPAGSYDQFRRRLTHHGDLLRLNAGAAYLLLVKSDLGQQTEQVQTVERYLKDTYHLLGQRPELLIEVPLDMLEKSAFTVWFPFQRDIAVRMSEIRAKQRDNFVTPELIGRYRNRLQPGDIMLERRNWFMTNVGIPGFWPHVAMYLGTPEQIDAMFNGLDDLGGQPASAVLAARHPRAWRAFVAPGASGSRKSVLEALRDGVVFNTLEESCNADYLAVLRPRLDRATRFAVISEALRHEGKPYDYNFDFATDGAMVCSELVYKAFSVSDVTFRPALVNGRLVLPPNLIARKFDEEYGTDGQQFDLVLFLDGSEQEQAAHEADTDTFRSSWQRPKWEVLLD